MLEKVTLNGKPVKLPTELSKLDNNLKTFEKIDFNEYKVEDDDGNTIIKNTENRYILPGYSFIPKYNHYSF